MAFSFMGLHFRTIGFNGLEQEHVEQRPLGASGSQWIPCLRAALRPHGMARQGGGCRRPLRRVQPS